MIRAPAGTGDPKFLLLRWRWASLKDLRLLPVRAVPPKGRRVGRGAVAESEDGLAYDLELYRFEISRRALTARSKCRQTIMKQRFGNVFELQPPIYFLAPRPKSTAWGTRCFPNGLVLTLAANSEVCLPESRRNRGIHHAGKPHITG